MANINWENLPSTNTPVGATNLNKVSAGLVNVGTSVDSTYRTNILKGVNLLNKNTNISGVLQSNGTIQTGSTYARYETSNYIKVVPNKKYTISRTYSGSDENIMRIGYYNSSKIFIERPYSENNPWTITTPSNCEYVRLSYATDTNTNVQLQLGETASSYEQYIAPSINVDNEEIYSKPVILWQNGSPTDAFASGSITLYDNLRNYSYYEVLAKTFATENNIISSGRIPTTFSGEISRLVKQLSRYRAFTNNNSSLTFSDAEGINTNATGSTSVNNSWLVPYQVIGYK